ncbi:MAG TPA: Gmad2 immunoglobulin-like domain-containing protein [Actinomycetota bacterium]
MRQLRFAFIALLLGGIVAGCSAGDRPNRTTAGGAAAAAPTTSLAPASDRDASTAPAATTRAGGSTATAGSRRQTAADPVAAAVAYLHREVGMRDPVGGGLRQNGQNGAIVEVHPRGVAGARPVTVVYLQRLTTTGAWYVLATTTGSIRVGEPWSQARVSSPFRVAGRAQAFEGNVQVRVTEDRDGTDVLLGSGNVTGGGDAMRPFAGRISFRQPTGTGGSVIFAERNAIDGDVLAATVVRVRLGATPPFPGIYEIRTWEQAYAVQDAVDNGHQPWRLSPTGVAGAYAEAVLLPGPAQASVRRTNPHTVAVRDPSGRLIATVDLAQPVKRGFDGIWVITRVGRPSR